jgi:hypothetical protein
VHHRLRRLEKQRSGFGTILPIDPNTGLIYIADVAGKESGVADRP